MTSIEAIEDIGVRHRTRLRSADLGSCEALIKAGATRRGRRVIAETIGVSEGRVLEWINKADLMRVRGISTRYSQLLEAVGVDSVRKLRRRRPSNLHRSLLAENSRRRNAVVSRLPSLKEVELWVRGAKKMAQLVR